MSPKVPALPTHKTSILWAPRAASSNTAAETRTSRTTVSRPNHNGTAPTTMTEITAVPTSTRSAVGSRTLPSVDTWCQRRATKPSTQSVAPRTAKSTAAAVWRCAPNNNHTKTGTQARRTRVMALGTVRMRSTPTSTSSEGAVTARSLRGTPVVPRPHAGVLRKVDAPIPALPRPALRQVRPPRQGHRPSL